MQNGVGNPGEDPRIQSWKEIASFFGRDERTVKRWEKTRNLPVHRFPGAKSGVFAYASELTEWLHSEPREKPGSEDLIDPAEEAFEVQTPTEVLEPAEEPNALTTGPGEGTPGARRSFRLLGFLLLAAAAVSLVFALRYAWSIRSRATAKNVATTSSSNRAAPSPAEDLYLQGRYFWSHRTEGTLRQAVDSFTQAVVRDPQYAPAYAGLAESYDLMPQYAAMPGAQAYPMAISAARKAIALDDSLAEAHRALGFALFYGQWNVKDAFHEYHRAIELNSSDVEAHSWYATSLLLLMQYGPAHTEIEKARELDPTSRSVAANEALILYWSGDHDHAVARLKDLQNDEPDYVAPASYLAGIYLEQKNYPAYIEEIKHVAAVDKSPDVQALAAAADKGWNAGGERGFFSSLRDEYLLEYAGSKPVAYKLAWTNAHLGRRQEADRYLQEAIISNDSQAINILKGDFGPAIESDPQFQQLKQQVRHRVEIPAGAIL